GTSTKTTGAANTKNKLDPTETGQSTATATPPVTMCAVVNGQTVTAGTLIVQPQANGDFKVTYLQSQALNDNRYGTGANAATGWSGGHKFSDLTRSDKADFRTTHRHRTPLLHFFL